MIRSCALLTQIHVYLKSYDKRRYSMTCKSRHLSRNKQDRSEDLNLKTVPNKKRLYLHARSFTEATCVVIEIFDKRQHESGPTF